MTSPLLVANILPTGSAVNGAGQRDLTFACVLADAAGRMRGALDVGDLWGRIVAEAVSVIPSDAAALVEHREGSWRLLAGRPGDTYPGASLPTDDDIADLARYRLLKQQGGAPELVAAPSTNGTSRSALLIGCLTGVSRRNSLRLIWFARSAAMFSHSVDIAEIFLRHVDQAVQCVVTRDTLQQAVAGRHRIGIAQGIVMTRHQLSAEQAFAVLQQRSQHTNVKLRTVADQVIRTGELPDHPTLHPRGTSTP